MNASFNRLGVDFLYKRSFLALEKGSARRGPHTPLSVNEGIKEGTFCGAVPGYQEPGDQERYRYFPICSKNHLKQ